MRVETWSDGLAIRLPAEIAEGAAASVRQEAPWLRPRFAFADRLPNRAERYGQLYILEPEEQWLLVAQHVDDARPSIVIEEAGKCRRAPSPHRIGRDRCRCRGHEEKPRVSE